MTRGVFARICQGYDTTTTRSNAFFVGFSLDNPNGNSFQQEFRTNCTIRDHNLFLTAKLGSISQEHASNKQTENDCFDSCRDSITLFLCSQR